MCVGEEERWRRVNNSVRWRVVPTGSVPEGAFDIIIPLVERPSPLEICRELSGRYSISPLEIYLAQIGDA